MPRNTLILIAVLVVVFLIFGQQNKVALTIPKPQSSRNLEIKKINGEKIELQIEVADDDIEHAQGLSGQKVLAENAGMLFIFPSADYLSFWMKDMNFALDIIWLDENWKIIDITKNVLPNTYPQTFSPRLPAQYVLEVNAGFVDKHEINIGQKISPPTGVNQ